MRQSLKLFIIMVFCLLLAVPGYSKNPSNKDYQRLSDSLQKAHDKCAKKVYLCVDRCSQAGPGDLLRCQINCAEESDACIQPENIARSRYKILNKKVLTRYEADTDACYNAMLKSGRKCDKIQNQTKKDKCLDKIQPRLKKCLTRSYKRFKRGERFPELNE